MVVRDSCKLTTPQYCSAIGRQASLVQRSWDGMQRSCTATTVIALLCQHGITESATQNRSGQSFQENARSDQGGTSIVMAAALYTVLAVGSLPYVPMAWSSRTMSKFCSGCITVLCNCAPTIIAHYKHHSSTPLTQSFVPLLQKLQLNMPQQFQATRNSSLSCWTQLKPSSARQLSWQETHTAQQM